VAEADQTGPPPIPPEVSRRWPKVGSSQHCTSLTATWRLQLDLVDRASHRRYIVSGRRASMRHERQSG